jgi:hypothetical protein
MQCAKTPFLLNSVYQEDGRVQLRGAADESMVGKRVSIYALYSGKVVARPLVRQDGLFSADAPLPPKSIRASNEARYYAQYDGRKSLMLKLRRRMTRSIDVGGARVKIAGHVLGAMAKKRSDQRVLVQQRISCTRWKTVSSVMPSSDGHFSTSFKVPGGAAVGVYRAKTQVRYSLDRQRLFPTFTLLGYLDFSKR